MAEQLGEAVLRITVDDSAARDSLATLRREITRSTRVATTGTAGTRGRTAGGARESAQAEFAAYKKLYALEQQINNLGQQGLNIDRLRAQLVQAFAATARGNFGTAKQLTNELGLQLQQERSILSLKQKQDSAAKKLQQSELQVAAAIAKQASAQKQFEESRSKAARAALATTGPGTTGFAPLSTTPAAQRQQQNAAARSAAQERRAQTATSQTAGGSGLSRFLREQDALAQAAASTRALAAALERRNTSLGRLAETAASQTAGGGGLTRFLREQDQLAQTAARTQTRSDISTRRADVRSLQTAGGGGLTSFLREVRQREEGERKIAAIRKAGYKDAQFAEKVLTAATETRTKKETAAQRQRGRGGGVDAGGVISSALIGGAFPLLFGQGGGAAGGGLIGGLAGGAFGGGGGFAGSLVGTLIGQTADKFGELAKALQDPIKNFDALIQGANLSGKGIEELAKVLIDLGRTSEANALIQADLSRTIDPVGILKVAAANDSFARTVGDVQERIGFLLAGPATQFISWIDQIIQRAVNLPGGRPTEQSALATRGQGTALGVGGVLLGAAGLAAAPFTGGASIPLALGGAGLATAGGAQIAAADFQQQQIAESAAIENLQGKILAIEERRIRVQRDISDAVSAGRSNTEAELRLQDRLLQLDAQREQAKAAFQAAPLDETGASVRALRSQLAAIDIQKRAAVDAEAQRKRALQATASLEAAQNQLALQSVSERIAAARQLATVEQGVVRSTIEQALSIKNSIAEARRREQDIGAQITAARQVGDESGAARLVGQQQVAAQETKLRIIEGATALRDAGAQLRKDAENARNQLQNLRVSNFKFLSPEEQKRAFDRAFSAAKGEADRAGVVFRTTGTLEERTRDLQGFADFRREERRLTDQAKTIESAINVASAPVVDSAFALTTSLDKLNTAVESLSTKNWAVQVNVTADGTSQATGDVVNNFLSVPQ